MSEWKEYRLGDLGTVITGKTPSAHNPEDWGDNMLFITPSDYRNYRKYATNSERKLSKVGMDRLEKKILPANSILVTCIGSDMGKVVINGEQCVTNQQINAIVPNTSVNNDFLYYRLISIYDTLRMYGGDGTAVPIVNKNDFENIKIEIPQLDEQKRIASILTSLDDKIDLLNRENATLEAMAEALFRQWFIEEAKEDWEKGKLGEICEYAKEKADIANIDRNTYITTENMCSNKQGVVPPSSVPENIKVTIYSPDDILLSNIRPYFKKLWLSDRNGGCSNDVLCIRSKSKIFKYFVYYTIRQDEFFDYVMLGSKGSKMPRGDKHHIMNWPIQKPPKQMLELFNEFVLRSIGKMQNNNRQILCLEKQRNTLLPKLMSNTNV